MSPSHDQPKYFPNTTYVFQPTDVERAIEAANAALASYLVSPGQLGVSARLLAFTMPPVHRQIAAEINRHTPPTEIEHAVVCVMQGVLEAFTCNIVGAYLSQPETIRELRSGIIKRVTDRMLNDLRLHLDIHYDFVLARLIQAHVRDVAHPHFYAGFWAPNRPPLQDPPPVDPWALPDPVPQAAPPPQGNMPPWSTNFETLPGEGPMDTLEVLNTTPVMRSYILGLIGARNVSFERLDEITYNCKVRRECNDQLTDYFDAHGIAWRMI